mmetsp:Transcript_1727/g.3334  ORF Transcript_1727/g.3334 Transcript_1727/m.3334 type:complete len:414 (+) Transcript_1727:300-1541(+)|eukprot:CAMPEP_0167802080 /NCGR_PEP_ID=MMETSP0111_2-20121227/18885_1 /TAXON_ID=91324 /ORGANISM="Lotharella globosa, Strain CCCM811" /LENGTH=413 /DNA_ID=CAMNT_0007698005 /DNA_START=253 /DNA_END=1494 /DNA_ORIENTATION=-
MANSGGLLHRIITFPARQPLAFGLGFSCIKTAFADLLVQKYIEKRKEIDWKRNSAFGMFGLFYLGGVQYCLYVPVFKRLFPAAESFATKPIKDKLADTAGQITMLKQVFLDQCVHHPLLYFPVFYAMKEVVMGGNLEDAKKKYLANYKEDIFALWKIWVPATVVNFTFMPMWGRIPFVATTSLFWTCILSYMRGSDPIPIQQEPQAMVWGNQGRALFMTLNKNRAKLKKDWAYFVVTSCGEHRTALGRLTSELYKSGGNIIASNAMSLSGNIVYTMVVGSEPDDVYDIVHTLENFEGCNITINKLIQPENDDHRFECSLSCIGHDRPGILSSLAEFLEKRDICIEGLQQNNTVAELDGQEHITFNLQMVVSAKEDVDLKDLQDSLDQFGKKSGLALVLHPNREDGLPSGGVWL